MHGDARMPKAPKERRGLGVENGGGGSRQLHRSRPVLLNFYLHPPRRPLTSPSLFLSSSSSLCASSRTPAPRAAFLLPTTTVGRVSCRLTSDPLPSRPCPSISFLNALERNFARARIPGLNSLGLLNQVGNALIWKTRAGRRRRGSRRCAIYAGSSQAEHALGWQK